VLVPLVDHTPALLTKLFEPSNKSRPVNVPALVIVAGPPDVLIAKSPAELAAERITPPALLVIAIAPVVLVAQITGLIPLPAPINVPLLLTVVCPP
jgi:hypothetical protein